METTNASLKYSPEYRTPKIQLKRERLFWLQTIILAGLVMISGLTFIFHNELVISKSIKLVFAPFLSIVPLIFIFTIIREWMRIFTNRVFSKAEIIRYSLITFSVAGAFTGITWFLDQVKDMEVLIAIIFAILSLVSFIGMKVKDVLGISYLTGIAEGLIIYMVFLF